MNLKRQTVIKFDVVPEAAPAGNLFQAKTFLENKKDSCGMTFSFTFAKISKCHNFTLHGPTKCQVDCPVQMPVE